LSVGHSTAKTAVRAALPGTSAAATCRSLLGDGTFGRRVLLMATFLLGLWILLSAGAGPARADPGQSNGGVVHAQARPDAALRAGHANERKPDATAQEPSASSLRVPDAGELVEPSEGDGLPPQGGSYVAAPTTDKHQQGPHSERTVAEPSDVQTEAEVEVAVDVPAEISPSDAASGHSGNLPVPATVVTAREATASSDAVVLAESPADPADPADAADPADPAATPPLRVDSVIEEGLPETSAPLDDCAPGQPRFAASSESRSGATAYGRPAAATSRAGGLVSFSGAPLGVPFSHPLPVHLPGPLSLPVPIPAPAPSGPSGPSANPTSGTYASAHDHTDLRDGTLAVLAAGLAAALCRTAVRATSGFAGAVVGGTDDPGARPD